MTAAPATVSIIDDDASVRKSLARLVRSAGHQVASFASADEFLADDRYGGPGCIVLDVRLPGLSGLGLQEKLGAAEDRMPIIFITGHGDIPMSVQAMKKGAMDFLTKPFEDEVLLEAIRQAIENDRKARAARAELAEIQDRVTTLTPREREVFALVVTGMLLIQWKR